MADSGTVDRRLHDFTGAGYYKGRSVLWQATWFAVQNLLFAAWWCPARLRPPILRVFGATVGKSVFIRHNVRVLWPWKLTIGENAWVGEGVWLLNLEAITVGANVCISQEAFLCTGGHDHLSETFEYDNAPIDVGPGAWVAAQALILRGVTIGRGALIGARAVVTKDVSPHARVSAGAKH